MDNDDMQGVGGGRFYPSTNIPTKINALEQELESLEESVNYLSQVFSNLSERLGPLVSPREGTPINKEAETKVSSPVVARIRNAKIKISAVSQLMNQLQDSLEV